MELAAGASLQGVAGSAASVTYTVTGNEHTLGVGNDFKTLAQGQLSNVAGVLGAAVPAGKAWMVSMISLRNTAGGNMTVKLYTGGTGGTNELYALTIPGLGSATWTTAGWKVYDSAGIEQYVGSTGPAGTVAVGSVTNVGAVGPPTVVNVGTPQAAVLNFGLQQGIQGNPGTAGVVQTVAASDGTLVAGGTAPDPTLRRAAITGDVGIPAASNTATLPNIVAAAGPLGSASVAPIVTVNAKGQVTALSSATITPAAIGAPSGSGTHTGASSGTNTGDQTDLSLPLETTGISPAYAGTATQKQFNINLNRGRVKLLNYIGASFVADDGSGVVGTDMGAVMNAILTGIIAPNKGGSIEIPGGVLMRQTTTILVQTNGTEILGGGCGYNSDTGNFRDALGTAFIWRGAAGQVQIDAFPSGSGGVGQNLKGFHLAGLSLDGRDNRSVGGDVGSTRADIGLRLRACAGWHVEDIYVQDCASHHIFLGALAPGTIAEPHDCTRGVLQRWNIRALDGGGAGGTVLPGVGLTMSGTVSANTCFNEISAGQVSYNTANTGKPAIDMVNTDSNRLSTVAVNPAGSLPGSNWGIAIRGGATAVEASRANRLDNVAAGQAGMILCGTAGGQRPDGTADASFNYAAPANNNHIDLNTENGEPYPFVGTGVTGPSPGASGGSSFPTQGFRCGSNAIKTVGPIAAITTVETRIIGMTVPKWFLYAGRQLRFKATGLITNTSTASTWTFRIRIGTVTLTGVVPASVALISGTIARTNVPFNIEAIVTIVSAGAAGTALGSVDTTLMPANTAVVAGNLPSKSAAGVTAAVAVNTLVANEIELTGVGVTGGPSFTPQSASIEAVN